jgi:hypothetical protein
MVEKIPPLTCFALVCQAVSLVNGVPLGEKVMKAIPALA